MADLRQGDRPLSPFMIGPYYRPQMTSISSIMVRITGIASLGTVFLIVAWLLAAASSESAFAVIDGILQSVIGKLLMFLLTWAIWYHIFGRLRHVIWDLGYCVEVGISEKMGWAMFIGATIFTVLTFIVALAA